MPEPRDDYDGAWKEALEQYFRPFLELCFPHIAAKIDWEVPIEFLDKELQEVVPDAAALGKQYVDKLVRVKALHGSEEWVLVHVEVQSRAERGLAKRLYQYHHRLADRFQRRIETLAVLADDRIDWRPNCHEEIGWGCRLRFDFATCKLLEFDLTQQQLAQTGNPVELIIFAYLRSLESKHLPGRRKHWKWQITRLLYEHGFSREDVRRIFRLIDWFMTLPEGLAVEFKRDLAAYEAEKNMPYITSIERIGREEGRQQGREEGRQEGRQETLREGILAVLESRFGPVPASLTDRINQLSDQERLRSLLRQAAISQNIDVFNRNFGDS